MELINITSKRDGIHFYGGDKDGTIYDLKSPVKITSVRQLAHQLRTRILVRINCEWQRKQEKTTGFFYSR